MSVWPDLAKFRHLGKFSKTTGKLLWSYLVFGKVLNLLWQFLITFRPFCAAVSSQIMKKIELSGHTGSLYSTPVSFSSVSALDSPHPRWWTQAWSRSRCWQSRASCWDQCSKTLFDWTTTATDWSANYIKILMVCLRLPSQVEIESG